MKPGKPAMLGRIRGRPVLGLPGYPLAAQTVLRELAAPLLESWGLAPAPRCTLAAKLSGPLSSDLGFDEFVPVSVGRIGGKPWGIPHSRGSAVQMATVLANGYVHVPAQVEGLEAGQELEVVLTTDPGSVGRTVLLVGTPDPALGELEELATARGLLVHTSRSGIHGAILALRRGSCHAAPVRLAAPDARVIRHLPPDHFAFLHLASISSRNGSPDTGRSEDYGLLIRNDLLDDPMISRLAAMVRSPDLKEKLGQMTGYDTSRTGEIGPPGSPSGS